jgi:hypothetical protein
MEEAHFMPKSSDVVTAMRVHVAPNVIPAKAEIGTSITSANFVKDKNDSVRSSASVHTDVVAALTTQKNVLGVPCTITVIPVIIMQVVCCYIRLGRQDAAS